MPLNNHQLNKYGTRLVHRFENTGEYRRGRGKDCGEGGDSEPKLPRKMFDYIFSKQLCTTISTRVSRFRQAHAARLQANFRLPLV